MEAKHCKVPPAGWHCHREPGHDGPCAAYPIDDGGEAVERLGIDVPAWAAEIRGKVRDAELERLRAEVADLHAIRQAKNVEIERLRQIVAGRNLADAVHDDDACRCLPCQFSNLLDERDGYAAREKQLRAEVARLTGERNETQNLVADQRELMLAALDERDALRAVAEAARLLRDYYDALPKYGVDQRPDLGVRIAKLDRALSTLDGDAKGGE